MRIAQVLAICIACSSLIVGSVFGGYSYSERINLAICYSCLGLQPRTPLFKDFWVNYPEGHEKSGPVVPHPEWVKVALKDNVVFIFLWQQGCEPCAGQWVDMRNAGIVKGEESGGEIGDEYKEKVAFFSLDVVTNENGSEAMRTYNPSGKNSGTPTTVILTLIRRETLNKVEIGWFSFIGPTSGSGGQPTVAQLKNILNSAIFYHQQNSAQWEDFDSAP